MAGQTSKTHPHKFGQTAFQVPSLNVAVLWEVIFIFFRIGNRSVWGSGRPRGPGRPFRWVGGFAPHLLEGSPGPPGPPRPSTWPIADPSKIIFFCSHPKCSHLKYRWGCDAIAHRPTLGSFSGHTGPWHRAGAKPCCCPCLSRGAPDVLVKLY